MINYCKHDGCDETLMQWQEYCYQHRPKTEEEKKVKVPQYPKQEEQIPELPEYPGNLQQPVENPVPRTQTPQEKPFVYTKEAEMVGDVTIEPEPDPKDKIMSELDNMEVTFSLGGEVPKLDERGRLIVKQVAFKRAVKVLIELEDLHKMSYDELLGTLQILTVDFYKIIVAQNEEA